MRLLVPCAALYLVGGLLRFERVGQVLRRWGHELTFATLTGRDANRWESALPLLSLAEAAERNWDAVMVPGGGHPDALIAQLPAFANPRFGLRVQHFLNGPARKPAYQRVAAAFDPQLIILNNQHWRADDLAAFASCPVRCLIGAVDTALFAPPTVRPPRAGRRLGAIANKNPAAMLDALDQLGEGWALHWFGRPDLHLLARHGHALAQGRLVSHGMLFGEALAAYYHGLDVFCSAETYAGWCNPAAEAMASGTPLVATHHGTLAFAQHAVTATILDEPSGSSIAEAVIALERDPDQAWRMAHQGRRAIRAMTWDAYAADLLDMVRQART